jgi:hypothetical protein
VPQAAGGGDTTTLSGFQRYPLYDSEDFSGYITQDKVVCFYPKNSKGLKAFQEQIRFVSSLYSGDEPEKLNGFCKSLEEINCHANQVGLVHEIDLYTIYRFLSSVIIRPILPEEDQGYKLAENESAIWTMLTERFSLPYTLIQPIVNGEPAGACSIDLESTWKPQINHLKALINGLQLDSVFAEDAKAIKKNFFCVYFYKSVY